MSRDKKRTLWNFAECFEGDKVVWMIVLLLFLCSIVCMFSSTSRLLKEGMTRIDLVKGQFLIVLIGLVVIIICYNIKSIRFFKIISFLGFPLSLFLLALLLMKIDTSVVRSVEINGARRILEVAGKQFHVFEAVKVLMVMYLSWAVDCFKRNCLPGNISKFWKKVIFIYAPFLIVFVMIIPGSNSSALFIGFIMFLVIALGGGSMKELAVLAAAALILVSCCYGIYQLSGHNYMTRIGTGISRIFDDTDWEGIYLNSPDREERAEALDKIRQPYSALIAVHEGGLIGKGPGQSTQRYVVPDLSEDYMFSFIIEEYGLIGGLIVIILYLSLLARASLIVRNCGNNLYAKLVVSGLTLLIVGQAFLHIFVSAQLGPMTGQTLPLLSHGDFAFLCFCFAFGVILSFSRIAARGLNTETRKLADTLIEHSYAETSETELVNTDNYEI